MLTDMQMDTIMRMHLHTCLQYTYMHFSIPPYLYTFKIAMTQDLRTKGLGICCNLIVLFSNESCGFYEDINSFHF